MQTAATSMTEAEILEVIDAFVRAAARARASGFDGVELFAAYHAVIDQFWTPWSNRRADRWGGSLENRVRFSATLLGAIREEVGDDFIIGLAVNVDPESDPSLSMESMQEIVAWHDARALMDYVTCGTGSYFDFYKLMPTSLYPARLGEPFAAALKQVTSHALVQAESHIRTPEAAESVLAAGHADMVSIVRGQIADPHLVRKAREGRAHDVRPCISCNQLCWGRRSRDYWISCLINPSAGREHIWGGDRFVPAEQPRTVLVVGAGPAGLEAARVSAERGHGVILAEAGTQIGGQYRLAGLQPTRQQVLDHIDWYARQLAQLGVDVRLDTLVDDTWIAAAGVDVVVVATGAVPARTGFQRAVPMRDRLPGAEAPNVASIEDVLGGRAAPSGRVLLIDDLGDWRGIGTAMFLQERGFDVCIATSAPTVAAGLFHSAADVPARQRFARAGGDMRPHTVVRRVARRRGEAALDTHGRGGLRAVRLARDRGDAEVRRRSGPRARSSRRRLPSDRRLRRARAAPASPSTKADPWRSRSNDPHHHLFVSPTSAKIAGICDTNRGQTRESSSSIDSWRSSVIDQTSGTSSRSARKPKSRFPL